MILWTLTIVNFVIGVIANPLDFGVLRISHVNPIKSVTEKRVQTLWMVQKEKKSHRYRLGGLKMKFSTRQKGRIPEKVVEYLLEGLNDAKEHGSVNCGPEKIDGNLLGEEYTPGGAIHEMEVAQRFLHPESFYVVGSCHTKNNNFQLIMRLPLTLSNGEIHLMKVLVDTGAEANLVRINLLPNHLFFQAPAPLKFRTANGQKLAGGERIISDHLGFKHTIDRALQAQSLEFGAVFFF